MPSGGDGVEMLWLKMRAIVIWLLMALRCSAPELSKQKKVFVVIERPISTQAHA